MMQQPPPDSIDRGPQGTVVEELFETLGGRKTGVEKEEDSVFDVSKETGTTKSGTTAGETDLEEGDIDASAG